MNDAAGVFVTIGFLGCLIGGGIAILAGESGVGWIFLIVGVPSSALIGTFLGVGPSARTMLAIGIASVVIAILYLAATEAQPGRGWRFF